MNKTVYTSSNNYESLRRALQSTGATIEEVDYGEFIEEFKNALMEESPEHGSLWESVTRQNGGTYLVGEHEPE